MLIAILFVVLLVFLLSLSGVQSYIANKITDSVNKKYGSDIQIERVDLSSLRNVELKNVLIRDHHQDSLIFVQKMKSSLLSIRSAFENNIQLGDAQLENGFLRMKTYRGEQVNNLTQFVELFDDGTESTGPEFRLSSPKLKTKNINFQLFDQNKQEEVIVFYHEISGDLLDFSITGPIVKARMDKVSILDNHLVKIIEFNAEFLYSPTRMEVLEAEIITDNSNISADIVFDYQEGDLSDFNNKVLINADIKEANLALIDLNEIYEEVGTKDVLHFSTHVLGTVNDFVLKDLALVTERKSEVYGDVNFQNILIPEKFYLQGDFDKIATSYNNLNVLLPRVMQKNLPEAFRDMGNITAKGTVALTPDKVSADIDTRSNFGVVNANVTFNDIQDRNKIKYVGEIDLKDFNLGLFAKDTLMGELSLEGKINGQGFSIENLNTTVIGKIYEHQYKGYTYTNIDVNGVFRNRLFNGELIANDPNLQMTFKGLADFSQEINRFDFKAVVDHADFKTLNLFTKYEKSILKGEIDINLTGNTIDNLVGEINFKNAVYSNENDDYLFTDFNVVATNLDSVRTIMVNSEDIVNGRVEGRFNYRDILSIARNALGSLYANYERIPVPSGQEIDFNFNIYNKIVEVFFPEVVLGPNTFVRGEIISDDDNIDLLLKSPEVIAYDNDFHNVRLQIDSKSPLYNTLLSIDSIRTKYYDADNFNLVNVTLNDTLYVRTDFIGGKEKKEKFDFSFYHTIDKNGYSVVGLNKSEILFKDNLWLINKDQDNQNKLVFDKAYRTFAIDKITMESDAQKIELAGAMGGEGQNVDLSFENVNLNSVTPEIDSLSMDGKVNGQISLQKKEDKYIPLAHLMINYFSINDAYYGDFSLIAEGNENLSNYNFDIELLNNDLRSLSSKGNIDFNQKPPVIIAQVNFDRFQLNAFSPLGKNVLSKIRGNATGNVVVSGSLYNPDFNGEIGLENAGFGFPYLNVDYDFTNDAQILIKEQTFDFQTIQITDTEMNTQGTLYGKIRHENFQKWFLDLNLTSDNLLVLNTEDSEDALYYGTGLIRGETTIYGPIDDLLVDVNATTNPGTKFVIPLSDVSTVGQSSLIHFVDPRKETEENINPNAIFIEQLKGLNLNFNLNVTKDAEAEVVIDKQTGSVLKGRGDGNLRLGIDMNGRFEMFGELLVDSGEYQFKNIVNKNFEVQQGGTIIWNGDPMDASINIEAIHRTKANPAVIIDNLSGSRKIDVDLITQISGSLSEAQFNFDIEIPGASSLVNSELAFNLANEDDKLTQFFSLLATGSFLNTDQRKGEFNGNAALAGTVAEQASSILSNVLSSSNDIFQIGVDYQVGAQNTVENVTTDDQLGILVSGRIGNKVIVNGKVGVPVGANTQSSVVGEVELLVPLNEAETLMGKVYNRQNEIQFDIIDSEGYTQGAGISYRFEFENSQEFLEKVGLKKAEGEKLLTKQERDSIKTAEKALRQKEKELKKKEDAGAR